ncbi:hypothetical protein BG004_001583, partial [Podila humilis]
MSLPYLHDTKYLDTASEQTPLTTIRMIFSSYKVPRSIEFAKFVAPLRKKHHIDIFMIPHESVAMVTKAAKEEEEEEERKQSNCSRHPLLPSTDVVLGFTGTLERLLSGIREFLQSLAPNSRGFYLWQLCLLVPQESDINFIGRYGPELAKMFHMEAKKADTNESSCSSFVPPLQKVLGRYFSAPFPESAWFPPDESLLAIESCSLENIMNAIEYVAQKMTNNNNSNTASNAVGEFYTGGGQNGIPLSVIPPWTLDASHFVALSLYPFSSSSPSSSFKQPPVGLIRRHVPMAYLLRVKLFPCVIPTVCKNQHLYHLQIHLSMNQAIYLMSEKRLDAIRKLKSSPVIPHNRTSSSRVGHFTATEMDHLAKAMASIAETLSQVNEADIAAASATDITSATSYCYESQPRASSTSLSGSSYRVHVYVPQRVVDVLEQDDTLEAMEKANADVDIVPSVDSENRASRYTLKPGRYSVPEEVGRASEQGSETECNRDESVRLEPDEVESIAVIKNRRGHPGVDGVQRGVKMLLDI